MSKKAPFLASQPGMTEGRAFLFIPIGNLPEGVAVFAGPTNLWNQFQSARDTVLSALALIHEAVPTPPTDPTGIAQLASALFRSRSPEEAAAVSADFLCERLGASRASLFHVLKKTPKLLACSGARQIDAHSPMASDLVKKMSVLMTGSPIPDCVGGLLSKWTEDPSSGAVGVVIEKSKSHDQADVLLKQVASMASQAIEAKRNWVASALCPATQSTAETRRRKLKARILFGGVAASLIYLLARPVPHTIAGPCELVPSTRSMAIAQAGGQITSVLVREGATVKAGQALFQIEDATLQSSLRFSRQQFAKANSESRRWQEEGDMKSFRTSDLERQRLEQESKNIEEEIGRTTVKSPIDGIVTSKDLELHKGEVVLPGTMLCEVASFSSWDLQIQVDERDAAWLQRAVTEKKALPVRYVLQAQSDLTLSGSITSPDQISQMVYPDQNKSIVFVTIRGIALPPKLQSELRPGFSGYAKIDGPKRAFILNALGKGYHFLRMHFLI
jgi:multidrug efflux pump subunit AcrA (membrane-fusion protein)